MRELVLEVRRLRCPGDELRAELRRDAELSAEERRAHCRADGAGTGRGQRPGGEGCRGQRGVHEPQPGDRRGVPAHETQRGEERTQHAPAILDNGADAGVVDEEADTGHPGEKRRLERGPQRSAAGRNGRQARRRAEEVADEPRIQSAQQEPVQGAGQGREARQWPEVVPAGCEESRASRPLLAGQAVDDAAGQEGPGGDAGDGHSSGGSERPRGVQVTQDREHGCEADQTGAERVRDAGERAGRRRRSGLRRAAAIRDELHSQNDREDEAIGAEQQGRGGRNPTETADEGDEGHDGAS